MQYPLLPSKVLKNIDKIQRNFIWDTNDTSKKLHLINWDTISKDNKESGLGIRSPKDKNTVNLANLTWRLLTYPNPLGKNNHRSSWI